MVYNIIYIPCFGLVVVIIALRENDHVNDNIYIDSNKFNKQLSILNF